MDDEKSITRFSRLLMITKACHTPTEFFFRFSFSLDFHCWGPRRNFLLMPNVIKGVCNSSVKTRLTLGNEKGKENCVKNGKTGSRLKLSKSSQMFRKFLQILKTKILKLILKNFPDKICASFLALNFSF